MPRKFFLFIGFMIITSCYTNGQEDKFASRDDSLRLMVANPSDFDSDLIAFYFYHWCGRQAMYGIDSTVAAFDSMLNFGINQSLPAVIGEAYYGQSSLAYMKKDYEVSKRLLQESFKYTASLPTSLIGRYKQALDVYSATGQMDTAYYYADKLFASKAIHSKKHLLPNAYIKYGALLKRDQRYTSAIEQFEKALALKEDLPSVLNITFILNNMGDIYAAINDHEKALEYQKQCYELAKANNYTLTMAKVCGPIGDTYFALDSLDKAIGAYSLGLDLLKTKNFKNQDFLLQSKLASVYLEDGNTELAKRYIDMAAGHYDENYGFEAMYIYQQSQAVYYNMVNTLKAKPYLDSALEIAKTNNRKGFIIRAYDELRKYYENIEQYKTALSYADSIRIVRIASIKEANTNYIYDHEIRYKKAEQDQQMTEMQAREEITQLNLSRKNTQLLLSGLGLIFALALIGGIYYFYRLKSNTNRLLTDKNEKLSTALNTNKMLVKEIHHRVKNNLQVVSSLLNLQGNYTEDEGILKAINTGRNRVQSMSLLHQNLYGNENLREIEINKYFTELTNSLIKEYPFSNGKQVDTHIDIDNLTIDIDTVVPLGLIVNELITNALKYAYKDQDNYVLSVSVKELEVGKLSVTVADNGPGLPFDELPNETSSLGTQLIRSFVEKLDADISIDNSKGTKISLVIPLD